MEPRRSSSIFLVCGEPSGDLHAAELVRELKQMAEVDVVAAGGERLAAVGAQVRWKSTTWGAIGLPEALRKLPLYFLRMRELVNAIEAVRPDLLLLVDFGAFNSRLAERVRRRLPGLKIFYYFPPASWDRRRRYFTRLLDATDYIATPFPWNAALLAAQGASVRWVGHPAVDRIRPAEDKARAKQALGADPEATVLALLPGSRALERRLLGETFLRAAEYIRSRVRKLQVFWSAVPGSQRDDWLAGVGARRGWVKPVANSAAILQAADVGLCCFGTVTLEAALAGCPVVAAYRGTLAMALVFSVMRIPTEYYSLPNIAAGKRVLPEFVGRAATPEALGDAVLSLLRDVSARQAVEKAYAKLREQLGPPGAARRAAEMVVGALQGKLEPHRRALG